MKKVLFIATLSISMIISAVAQPYQKTELGIKSVINRIGIEVQFYNPSMVRIIKWPEGNSFKKESLSVIATPQKTSFKIKQEGDKLLLTSEKLTVILNIKNGMISFATSSGKQLLDEKDPGVVFSDFNDAGVGSTVIDSMRFIIMVDCKPSLMCANS